MRLARSTFALAALLSVFCSSASSAELDYGLKAEQVAPNVYAVLGRQEHFSRANGGNILNTGFIVTDDGVVVVDTGPSRRYGEALRTLIANTTDQRIAQVFITHLHPDHMLGNQAFADVPISALAETINGIRHEGEAFTDAMYVMAGDWMRGTELKLPTDKAYGQSLSVGGRDIMLLALAGHSDADLAVYDVTSGVLFAGDLVFHGRAPTTPHAVLENWQASLEELSALKPKVIVPGHGPIDTDSVSIAQTSNYLRWLDETFENSAKAGFDMNELMNVSMPPAYRALAVMPEEFERSVAHLFADYEQRVLVAAEQ